MDSNPPQLALTTDDKPTRPLPTNVRIAQAMGWAVVNNEPLLLPHFILPDGEVLFFDEFTPDLDPVSWQMVERWMVDNLEASERDTYVKNIRGVVGTAAFDVLTASFSTRCDAFVWAVEES